MRKGLIVDPELLAAHGISGNLGVNMYGMIETAMASCAETIGRARGPVENARDVSAWQRLGGSLTRAPGVIPVGEQGEVTARGPNLMRGYSDGSDADTIDEDGFFHTGDVGLVDANGHLRYLDRGAAGRRHRVRWRSRVDRRGALIVLESSECVTTAEVDAHCRQELSSYKVPKIRAVDDDEYPLSLSFKADRIAVQALCPRRARSLMSGLLIANRAEVVLRVLGAARTRRLRAAVVHAAADRADVHRCIALGRTV